MEKFFILIEDEKIEDQIKKKQECQQLQFLFLIFMLSPFTEHQWVILRKNILEKYNYEHIVDNQVYIQRQKQLLQEFENKFDKKRMYDSLNSFTLTNISSIQNLDMTDDSSFLKSKFTEEFQYSIINSALKQVKTSCSEETYQTVRNYMFNNKQKQYDSLLKSYNKMIKENEQLATNVIIKQRDYSTLEKEMFSLKEKSNTLEEEKKKVKKKMDQIMEKQNRISKIQISMVFKEKLNMQGKRRYQRQFQISSEVQKKINKIYEDLNKLWDNIFTICQQKRCYCEEQCWKKQVMRKAKDKIIEERNILKQEQKQLEAEYQVMQNISDQFKKIFNMELQKDKSQISNRGSSRIVE